MTDWPDPFSAIRAALETTLLVDGVQAVLGRETGTLPELLGPVVALVWTGMDAADRETGDGEDETLRWKVSVYVPLDGTDADGRGLVGAQHQLEAVVPALFSAIRADPSLGGVVDWARLADTREDPVIDTTDRFVRKSLTLSVERYAT